MLVGKTGDPGSTPGPPSRVSPRPPVSAPVTEGEGDWVRGEYAVEDEGGPAHEVGSDRYES